jgi:ADP-heptose synthase, bifunctional sugar kinase/adenylyltransferase
MTRQQAETILARFYGLRVLVIGDLMADRHVWGNAGRVSPEAPVLVVDVERETFVPGGAANVAHQLQALGASVVVAGVVGADENGERLKQELAAFGCDVRAVVTAPDRPTTTKTRIVAGSQQIVRVDREHRAPLPDGVADALLAQAREALGGCAAVLFSDYVKGALGRGTVAALVADARRAGVVTTANPKPTSARFYKDVDVAQFNRSEADQAHGGLHRLDAPPSEETFHAAGARLREGLEVRNLLVTRSAEGMTLFKEDGSHTDVQPHRVEVFDGTGAGDSTIAGVTLALAAGATPEEAARIGNAAGGAVVRKVGVATATREEIAALFQ